MQFTIIRKMITKNDGTQFPVLRTKTQKLDANGNNIYIDVHFDKSANFNTTKGVKVTSNNYYVMNKKYVDKNGNEAFVPVLHIKEVDSVEELQDALANEYFY